MSPRLLDLFCGAGGASHGYVRAGFEVTGIDLYPQPEYPYTFVQADWRAYLLAHADEYDFIHASPVCKGYSTMPASGSKWAREIPEVRGMLKAAGLPYVIENVRDARWDMIDPVQVCGSYFRLRVRRHRYFESSMTITGTPCEHAWQDADKIYVRRGRYSVANDSGVCPVNGNGGQLLDPTDRYFSLDPGEELSLMREAMGIGWMSRVPLTQAIPPAYTEWIGRQLLL